MRRGRMPSRLAPGSWLTGTKTRRHRGSLTLKFRASFRYRSTAVGEPDELRHHQRALRILIVVLIPLAIWTVVGLIAFWPGDISRHVNSDVAGYSVPGVTYPTARITGIKEISCEGLSGSTPERLTPAAPT